MDNKKVWNNEICEYCKTKLIKKFEGQYYCKKCNIHFCD